MTRTLPPYAPTIAASLTVLITSAVVLWPEPTESTPPRTIAIPRVTVAPLPPLAAALDAPLFSASRKPPTAAQPDEAPPPPPAPPPILVGTLAGSKGAGIALLKLTTGTTVTLGVGDLADGWRLIAVGNGSATLAQGDRQEVLNLDFSNKQPAGGQPAATTAATPGSSPE